MDQQQAILAEYLLESLISEPTLFRRQFFLRRLLEILPNLELPVVAGNRAHFLYYGFAHHVHIAGDWTRWQIGDELVRISGTMLFYRKIEFPETARLQYKLIVDGNWQTDPRNSRASEEGFGINSEFWMPQYRDESFLKLKVKRVKRGSVKRFEMFSFILKEQREIFVYFPQIPPSNSIRISEEIPILIIHDGVESQTLGKFHQILDNLIATRAIPTCTAIFISPKNRNIEYGWNEEYNEFCVREALNFGIAILNGAGFKVSDNPQWRCVTGASLGGLMATQTCLKFPEIVGAFMAQSPAYWYRNKSIFSSQLLQSSPRLIGVLQSGSVFDTRENTLRMFGEMSERGAKVCYQETAQGHTWGNWRTMFAAGVRAWANLLQAE